MQQNLTLEEDVIRLIDKDINRGSTQLINLFSKFLLSKAKYFGWNLEDAEEVVSDLLFKAIIKIRNKEFLFKEEGNLRAWLYISLKNKYRDEIERNSKINKEIQTFCYDESEFSNFESEEKSPYINEILRYIKDNFEVNFKEDQRKTLVSYSLNDLKEEEQFCILSYLNNEKHSEIATILKCSEDAAKKRVGRALYKFCDILSQKIKINAKDIYNELKNIHKQDSKGRINKR